MALLSLLGQVDTVPAKDGPSNLHEKRQGSGTVIKKGREWAKNGTAGPAFFFFFFHTTILTSGAVGCRGPGGCCRRRWK